jgi:hypothetical protein
MSLSDFLFNGVSPPSVTTYGQTTSDLPAWLSDYTQGLIAKANTIADQPYQQYQGPRIADFTPDQTAAFNATRSNVGAFQPGINNAINLAGGATGAGALNAATPYLTGAASMYQQSLDPSHSTMNAAQPYIAQAGQTFNNPGVVQSYMDPYVGNVIDRATQLAMRNYNSNVMPGINDQFVRSGQYGSSAHERAANAGARDLTEGIQGQALGALSGAYNQAGQLFGQDTGRLASLGTLAGNLTEQDRNALQSAAAGTAATGTQLGTLGLQQGALQNQSAQNLGALSQVGQSMGIKDAASLAAIGQQQQQQNQGNLDLAYNDFQNQTNYPKGQIDWLSNVIHGVPTDKATTSTQVSPMTNQMQLGASPLSSLASLADIYAGISSQKARGGVIRYAYGGPVVRFKRGGHVKLADVVDGEFTEPRRGALAILEAA